MRKPRKGSFWYCTTPGSSFQNEYVKIVDQPKHTMTGVAYPKCIVWVKLLHWDDEQALWTSINSVYEEKWLPVTKAVEILFRKSDGTEETRNIQD